MTTPAPIRCAIYTRKSTDEGLDQEFNSLDAQYEACAAYIASQRHEGWRQVTQRYDDGGISGGTIERPALQRLLAEIDAGRIGMVVVYKIDRLTRSLADFVRLVERLEAKGCSFVSVTQAFNTSSSMGRLTLNVLLSFAQFEREVTAERIRDKIAASKKKGLWMGSRPALGYDRHPDPQRRELVINNAEADTVQALFRLYAEHGNLHAVEKAAQSLGLQPKRLEPCSGHPSRDSFSRGQLRYILTNPVYIGRIRHKDKDWPGLHSPIVDDALWQTVQDRLATARDQPSGRRGAVNRRALRGKLFDETGRSLTTTHSLQHGRRYEYYASRRPRPEGCDHDGWCLPVAAAETAIRDLVSRNLHAAAERHLLLAEPDAAIANELAGRARNLATHLARSASRAASLVVRVDLRPGSARLFLDAAALSEALGVSPDALAADLVSFEAPLALRRRGSGTRIITGSSEPIPDRTLLRALSEARGWARAHRAGTPLAELARAAGRSVPHLREHLALAFLCPQLQAAICDGRQPEGLTKERLLRTGIPLDWTEQRGRFGFEATRSL